MSDCRMVPIANEPGMPSLGLGLWKIAESEAAATVGAALEMGYRHLDCACDYGNEVQVGDGIQRAIQQGVCQRDQLWVTSKLWNTFHRPEHVRRALERSLSDLQLDTLDLYLIHFPISLRFVPFELRYPPGWIFNADEAQGKMIPDSVPIADTWGAMEELVRAGLCRHIGVSNFGVSLLRDLLATARIKPSVLQVESHPYLTQTKLLRFCLEQGIAFTAFSPLGAGSYVGLGMASPDESVLSDPTIESIAARHQKTPAQIALRWGVQRGTSVIPKSSRRERLEENLAIFDFELTTQEVDQITSLDRNRRFNDPGVFCEQAFGCFYPIYE
jgi:D-xylose reductase